MTEEMVYKAFYQAFVDSYPFINNPKNHNISSYVIGLYDMASVMLELIQENKEMTEDCDDRT